MTNVEEVRSLAARAAAELALVRVVHHYGGRPEFVLLGGLVPALLCAGSSMRHAGTNDVDVQVNLEIAGGSTNAARLEQALRNAEFEPDSDRTWRWSLNEHGDLRALVKFELLADLDTQPSNVVVKFADCEALGAANLRGTGYATRDVVVQQISANDHDTHRRVEINVTGLAGFLLAKTAAAHGRRKPKDWYDIAFVLLNNDHGDSEAAARRVMEVFGSPEAELRTQILDLQANFETADAQGTGAYVDQIILDHPEVDPSTAAADAQLAVRAFTGALLTT